MSDNLSSEIENVDSTRERDQAVMAIVISIVGYMLLAGLAVAILPDKPVPTSIAVTVCILFASMILAQFYPNVLSLRIPRMSVITLAVLFGASLNLVLIGLRPDPYYIKLLNSLGTIDKIIYLLVACVLSPISQEIYFRGLLLPILTRRFGLVVAISVSIVLFVIYHDRWTSGVMSLTFQGALYTWIAVRSGTVTSSIVAHITYNSTWFLAALLKQ